MAIINMVIKGGSGNINNQDKIITENGTYVNDDGYTGLGTITVNVPTFTNVLAYPNAVDAVENKKVLLVDGNLTLVNNPIESSNNIVSICDNGFCLTNDGSRLYLNKFEDGIIGEVLNENTEMLETDYSNLLNGLKLIQYPMHANSFIVTNSILGKRAKNVSIFGNDVYENIIRKEDYVEQKCNIIGSFADRFVYHVNNGTIYVYDIPTNNVYNMVGVEFNNIELDMVGYEHSNMAYFVDYNTNIRWYADLNEDNPNLTAQSVIQIDKIGLDILGTQQSKDGKYILCKDGYITVNDNNDVLTEHRYPQVVLDAMGGVGVHHFQALYNGYYGFGMDDGRYILCWYDSETETIENTIVWVYNPYIIDGDDTIYHRFFSGYANYWVIPSIASGTNVASKREVEIRKNLYTVMTNDGLYDKSNKLTHTAILTGETSDSMVEVKTILDSETKTVISVSDSSETLIIEGVE